MKLSKIQLIFLTCVLLLAAAFLFLPKLPGAYLRAALESEFSARFDCSSQSESFTEIHFKNVTLKNRKSGMLMLEADGIRIKTGLLARLNFGDLRQRLRFENPTIHLQKEKSGTWNWFPAADKFVDSIDAAKARPASLNFAEGKVHYKDASQEPEASFQVNFSSAEFSYKRGGALNGAIRITGGKAIPGIILLGFTYENPSDSLTFQISSTDGKLEAHGTVQDFSSNFYTEFAAKIRQKEIKLVSPDDIGFAGLLSVQAEGSSQGAHPESFLKYLSLSGAFDIRHGTLLRENILGQILRSLKPVASLTLPPGKDGQPPDYQGLIRGADTAFHVLQTQIEVAKGTLQFGDLRIKHPEYYMEGEGAFDIPNRKIDFRARFVPLENLSAWFIQENAAFKAFQNDKGRLILPFLYRGLIPDVELEMNWDEISAFVKDKEIKEAAEKLEAAKGSAK